MEGSSGVRRAAILVFAGLLLQVPSRMRAQDPQSAPPEPDPQSQNDQDPPGRVARLNFIDGAVSFQPGGESEWVDASLNRPLVSGDNLWADENSRAEVEIGSTDLRLGSKTGVTFLEVSDSAAQIRLAQGSLIVNVRRMEDGDAYEIDTPNVAFVVMQPGDYRVDVDPEGYRTNVTVWRGRGQVTGGGSSYTVVADQYASFYGSDRLNFDVGQIPDNDDFDSWAAERDRHEDDSEAANYVSGDMTGYEDLDSYGSWVYLADYGYVWRPTGVSAGWAPYRFGRWAYIAPWGWTWVAEEPWGFAPYHYGRWAYTGSSWIWVPGSRAVRPVYAPALVGWVGGGQARFSFGAGVGWFPLAPGEVFVPGYRVSSSYVTRVNVTNTNVSVSRVTNIYETRNGTNNITYANRGVNGGVTVVSRDTFVNSRSVERNVVTVSSKEINSAPASHMAEIEPGRTSVLGSRAAAAHQPPASVTTRTVVASRTPAAAPQGLAGNSAGVGRPQQAAPLVRQQQPGTPVALAPVKHVMSSEDGLHSFEGTGTPTSAGESKPHVWEEQGTPQPEPSRQTQPANKTSRVVQQRPAASSNSAKQPAPAPAKSQQAPKEEEQYSSWHSQKPATPATAGKSSTSTSSTTHPQSSTASTHSSSTSNPPPKK